MQIHKIRHEQICYAFDNKNIHKPEFLKFLEESLADVEKEITWYKEHIPGSDYKYDEERILSSLESMKRTLENYISRNKQ